MVIILAKKVARVGSNPSGLCVLESLGIALPIPWFRPGLGPLSVQMRYSFCPTTFEVTCKMAYVVTENCIKCKYTDCVDVCPVDCFHEGPNFLAIDPDECIDCTLCVAECPAEAIFAEDDVPENQRRFIALNAELAKTWPVITERREPLPSADEWNGKLDKIDKLER